MAQWTQRAVRKRGVSRSADCERGKGWTWRDGKAVREDVLRLVLCGITPGLSDDPQVPVIGGVTRFTDGSRLVVVPDRGYDRWVLLSNENVIVAVSARPHVAGLGVKGWTVLSDFGRCTPPQTIFAPNSLSSPASFACPAEKTERPARPITAEGVPVERWNDEVHSEELVEMAFSDAEAEQNLDAFLRAVQASEGAESVAYAEALQWVGVRLFVLGLGERSLAYLQRSVDLFYKILPAEHPLVTMAENSLWDATSETRKHFGMAPPDRWASLYDRRRRSMGPDSSVTVASLKILVRAEIAAGFLSPQTELWEARLTALRSGHDSQRRTQWPYWTELDETRALLVEMYCETSRFQSALDVIDETLEATRAFGDDERAAIEYELLMERSAVLDRAGRPDDARAARERAELLQPFVEEPVLETPVSSS